MIIMNYIEVNCLQDLFDISENLKMSLGATVAAFGEAMRTFEHPAAHRSHRWDLTRADRHREVLSLLPERQKRSLLGWAFDSWTNGAAPFLHQLPWQFIHGDMNPENILVAQDEVVGLLDFGDGLFNPAVCDLAICLAYQMMDQSEPLVAARRTISGYESIRPLSDREHAVLLPLVLGRLAVTLSVATRRRQIDPGHANWYVSEAPAWRLLNTMFQRVRSEAKGLDGWCPVTP